MEQYIVSARKYRPNDFESLIGQDNIARTLKNSILKGQLSHAYLFCGPRGVGKTTTARIFAKMINCEHPREDMEPCGVCESCVSFAEGRSYCIHELDAASNNGIDDIKALIDQVRIPPQVGKYGVYIIDEVHMLSQAAFNAFLKTLEEPPAHAIFILATTEKHKVLPTILSRCQTFDFNRIPVRDIVFNLRKIATAEGVEIDDNSLSVIAQKADGAMRDALTLFDQTVAFCGQKVRYEDVLDNLGVLASEQLFALTDELLAGDYKAALIRFDGILSRGFNAQHFIGAVSAHLRNLLVAGTAGMDALLDMPDAQKETFRTQAARCSVRFLYDALAVSTQCEAAYRGSINPRLQIEFALLRLAALNAAPAAQPVREVPAAPPVAEAPSVQPVKETPAAAPVSEAPQPEPAPEPSEAVSRSPRRRGGGVSLKALGGGTTAAPVEELSGDVPSEEQIRAGWQKLAGMYGDSPRLAGAISSGQLDITLTPEVAQVVFKLGSEPQRDWVVKNKLSELQSRLSAILGTGRICLDAGVVPLEDRPKQLYMPSEQARAMQQEHPQLKDFVETIGGTLK